MAQAKAETRRAMAVALEQEMKAKVVEAESEVPLAMADAFKKGNLGVLDYYKLIILHLMPIGQSIAGVMNDKKTNLRIRFEELIYWGIIFLFYLFLPIEVGRKGRSRRISSCRTFTSN